MNAYALARCDHIEQFNKFYTIHPHTQSLHADPCMPCMQFIKPDPFIQTNNTRSLPFILSSFFYQHTILILCILTLITLTFINQPTHSLLRRTLHNTMSQIQQVLISRPARLINTIPYRPFNLFLRTE